MDPTPDGDHLSGRARLVWAKNPDRLGESVMSLAQHLRDSAAIAGHVWEWLPRHTRALIERAAPRREGRLLLQFLAGVHDIGKCSPPFASKVPALADRMVAAGFEMPGVTSNFRLGPHGVVGQLVFERWLAERYGVPLPVARSYGVVIGGHHGAPPTRSALNGVLDRRLQLVGGNTWVEVQDELLDDMTRRLGAADLLSALTAASPLPVTAQTVLSGAVIVSDWLASNEKLFELRELGDDARADRAWQSLGLPPTWRPETPEGVDAMMATRFPRLAGRTPRPVQALTVAAAEACETPGLLIVEAEMGSGKTEAALMAAETLAARFGCGGVYVALPTMATSDAMFRRVLSWVDHLDGPDALSTHLAHGKARLNQDYQELVEDSRARGIYDDTEPPAHAEAQVAAWLSGRRTGVLASMVVGTIDQLLFTALQAKHLVLRHLALAGKVVIIDEAHAADDYMREYLARTLEWLGAYGTPVVLMSATLPHGQRQQLADAYRRGLGLDPEPLPDEAPYPSITAITARTPRVHAVAGSRAEPSRIVEVQCRAEDDDLAALLSAQLVDGGCVAVIRNTVGRAQHTARLLRERLPDIEVLLVHSRFVATHRAAIEERLRDMLGPGGSSRPHRLVVVGTQVLEQSLDIDFDVMVSDLAPTDLLLQRIGRLHRHQRGAAQSERPPGLRAPRLFVTGVEEWGDEGLPIPARALVSVYGLSRLLRCAAVLGLSEHGSVPVDLPGDIRLLVETAYGDDAPGPVSWRAAIAAADAAHARLVRRQVHQADEYRVRPVRETSTLIGWLEHGAGTQAEDPRSPGASRVRDSEDGLEVIVVQRGQDGEVVYLRDGSRHDGKPALPLLGPPSWDIAQALAAATIRLPLSMTHPGAIDSALDALEANGHEGWQQSGWLRGQLALHLDDDWRACLGPWSLTYDLELGLEVDNVDV